MTKLIPFIVHYFLESHQPKFFLRSRLFCAIFLFQINNHRIKMMKLLVLAVLCGMAIAGHHGHGGYGGIGGGGIGGIGGGGIGGGGIGGGGGGGYGGGWGWKRPYYGWANVNAWQTPHAYQYGLQEQGKGYQKYIWQGADFHKGWGHGGGYAG